MSRAQTKRISFLSNQTQRTMKRAAKPSTRSSTRGRGRGRGSGRQAYLRNVNNEDNDKEDQQKMQIETQQEPTIEDSQETTFELPDDLELAQKDTPLEAIQEEGSANNGSKYSGETVRRGNCPEIL